MRRISNLAYLCGEINRKKAVCAVIVQLSRQSKEEMKVMKIVFATANAGKLREARGILGEGFEVVSPADLGHPEDIEETGKTLKANSLLKAKYIVDNLGLDCFSDDSGLEVDVLGLQPGIMTARYAGVAHDSDANMSKLLREMDRRLFEASIAREFGLSTPYATRRARFRTVVTLILDGKTHFFEGVLEGKIGLLREGTGGFGYDPIFIPDRIPLCAAEEFMKGSSFTLTPDADGLVPNVGQLTNAQLGDDVKNQISHRGKAMRQLVAYLKDSQAS